MSDYSIENTGKKKKPYYKNNKYKNKPSQKNTEGEEKLPQEKQSTAPANDVKEKNTPGAAEKPAEEN